MKIETKFKAGDHFWRKANRTAHSSKVDAVIVDEDGINYRYYDCMGNNKYEVKEENSFATKEECNLAIIEEIAGETRKE